MLQIDILNIFPEMFKSVFEQSIIKRAQEKRKVEINLHNLRDFTDDKHRKVDDSPFGGGPGMVMMAQPIFEGVAKIRKYDNAEIILFCAQGKIFNQKLARQLSKRKQLILICPHYEGVDERVRKNLVTREISIGDYILTGGELPAMVLVDAVTRLLPGVLGNKKSVEEESFAGNLLEYPHYTRPADFRGLKVPQVLLCGNHKKIEEYRRKEALKRTKKRRPDLLILKAAKLAGSV